MSDYKHLTPLEYDRARTKAGKRTQDKIGDKPTRDQFKREYGSVFTIMDIFAAVIFIAAWIISSTHIISLMTDQAITTYKSADAGLVISQEVYTLTHQVGMVFLAEASAILFMVMYSRMRYPIFLGMAALASLFVLYANVVSGLNLFIAVLPPVFTLGIGYRLEQIIAEILQRRADLDSKYTDALNTWQAASEDYKQHPDYIPALLQEVYAAVERKNSWTQLQPGQKRQVAEQEIQRHEWTGAAPIDFQEEAAADQQPAVPFGNYRPGADENGSTPATPRSNGHIDAANVN